MSARRRRPAPPDPFDPGAVEVRRIQPYQATKGYTCPWCHQNLASGIGHVVVIPYGAADLRRHWHHGCWQKRVRAG